MNLEDYLRKLMKEKNLSAHQVERNSGGQITGSYVTRMLRGEVKRPSVQKLRCLARGLGSPLEEILQVASGLPEQEEWSAESLAEAQLKISRSPELTKILKGLLKMNPDELKRVLKYVNRQTMSE
ncbi:MAG: helix-turn-helix domain-containing protein [Blastocatellia bacterium]